MITQERGVYCIKEVPRPSRAPAHNEKLIPYNNLTYVCIMSYVEFYRLSDERSSLDQIMSLQAERLGQYT